jgi:DNA-binding response OmpR family regulator
MQQRVLIVDDSVTVRMDLEQALATAGFAPVLSGDLASARRALAGHAIDLIVLDMLLPDGDGTDLVQQIKQDPATARIPVLILSTEAEVKERLRGLAIGADDFVGKPYDCGYLIQRAHELLRQSSNGASKRDVPQILVIDDSLSIREELRTAIELRGYQVHTADTGEEGLRLAARIRPDAAVVDSQLPGIDGATVVRRLRGDAALRGIPCLLLTASDEKSAEVLSFEAGADTFMRKGEGTEVILARLEAMLRSSGTRLSRETAPSLYGPKRILAVDDSLTYLHALIAALGGETYDIIPATSGEEALALLSAQAVDCILLDLVMPGLSGEDICHRIKQSPNWAGIPVIMLTARDDREAMLGGFRAGADDFVCKSSEFELLSARLRAQLRRKQHEDENRRIREEMLRKEADMAEAKLMRELAETRAALLHDLEQSNKELEAFSYSVSHDLRSPLRAINGFVNIVLDDYAPQLPAEAQDYLHSVRDNTHFMGQLIDDLLAFSKLGRQALSCEDVDLTVLVADVVHQLRHEQKDRRIDMRVGDLGHCRGDCKMLRQVLVNLVGNAIKYTGKRETAIIQIDRRVEDESGALVYSIKDNGAGFDPRFANKLFGVFQRLHRAEEFEGTGVGLAIVDRIVKRHGGRVWAESKLDEGATFFFTLDANRTSNAE